MTRKKSQRGAVLQFEIDLARWKATAGSTFQLSNGFQETPMNRAYAIAKTAVCDTLYHGGTFVVVVSETKVTMIQRPDAEEFEEEAA